MTADSAERTASRMNEIRHFYVEFNNSLCKTVSDINNSSKPYGIDLKPCFSIGIKNFIEFKLKKVKEIVVNSISNELNLFLSPFAPNPGSNKKAKRFSKKVIEILENSFRKEKYPSDNEKSKLANLCLISSKQVNNWFTNKRNRSKIYKNDCFLSYDK